MALKGNVSGTWKDYVAWVNVSGTWKKAAVWQNVAGVWKQITALLGATLPASLGCYWSGASGTVTCSFSLSGTGTWSGSGYSDGTWMAGGPSSEYEARWTTTSGTLTSGTAGSWLNLGTTRTWTRNRTTNGISQVTGTVEIRMAASPNTVFTTSTVTLTAERGTL